MHSIIAAMQRFIRRDLCDPAYCSRLHEQIQLLNEERQFQRVQAEYLASHDPLTGLPNRSLFRRRIVDCIQQASEEHHALALMFLDLDNFKMVNDTLGHQAGDALLIEVVARLRGALDGRGFLARLGGDEFGLLLHDVGVGEVFGLAHALIDAIRSVYELEGHRVSTIGVSVGMALYPEDGDSDVELLRHADAAMYESKRAGKNRVTRFHAEIHQRLLRRSQLEELLREAIRTGEGLSLALQPKVRIQDQIIIGFEALARWRIPGYGAVSPLEFIPLAEETGLIAPLTHHLLREAVWRVAELDRWGWPNLDVAVNISPRQFNHPDLEHELMRAHDDFRVSPERIELEITESTLLEGKGVIDRMRALSDKGFRLGIDDFGTGFSSLSYLKRLPADTLKIDRAFIAELEQDQDDRVLVKSIISIADHFGMNVVAEGVEYQAQREILHEMGCGLGQGYLWRPPIEDEEGLVDYLQGQFSPAPVSGKPSPDSDTLGYLVSLAPSAG